MAGWLAGGVVLGGTWLGVSSAQSAQAVPAALGKDPGTVELVPASGPTSSKPTWATTVACPSGYQGSGLFSEVNADGTYDSIAPVVNGTNTPFKGTLQGTIAHKALGNIPNGGSQELFVICASQQSALGKTINYMSIYITYSANGATYSTSATTSPASSASSAASSSSGASGSGAGTTAGAGTSCGSGGTSSGLGTARDTSPTSAAPSPSAMDSSFAVTG